MKTFEVYQKMAVEVSFPCIYPISPYLLKYGRSASFKQESTMENKQFIALAVFLLSTILVVSTIALAKVLWTFEMKGVIVQYGLYVTYPNGTLLDVLDFGEMERSENYTQDVVVHNNGTTELILSLNVPSNTWTIEYSSVTWDREGHTLPAGENVTATIRWEIKSTASLGEIPPITIGVEGS